MLFKKNEGEVKLSGPKLLPDPVRKYLVGQKANLECLYTVRALLRGNGEASDIRLFDETEAMVREVTVKDYTSLDAHPELILWEGKFDKKGKNVQLTQKREPKPIPEVPILTALEIRQKIEAVKEPGSSVYFYLAGSPKCGGPLGRGCAVVEMNPPGEKVKKYNVYVSNVDGLDPVGKKELMFQSDKVKEITSWIAEKHYKPSRL